MAKVQGFAAAAGEAGELLRQPVPAWKEVEARLIKPIRWLSSLTPTDQIALEPFFLANALEAVTATWVALESHDRRGARLAVERLRQTLNDMAEAATVGPTTDRGEVVSWLSTQLRDIPLAELAALVGTSPRTWQRWLTGEAEPRGEQADRLRSLAQTVAHLRHAFTAAGCLAWLRRPHPDLDDRPPIELLADPLTQRDVIDTAAGARVGSAA